jgi:hypothetical protein
VEYLRSEERPNREGTGRNDFEGAAIFAETMRLGREGLGERITRWLADHREREPVEAVVLQSSDQRFHCLTIVLFWRTVGKTENKTDRSGG